MKRKVELTDEFVEEFLREKLRAAQKKIEQLEKKIDDHNLRKDRNKPVELYFKD